jgi:hypothetical protein
MKHGIPNEDAGLPTPLHDDKAISSAEPAGLDEGKVQDAYATNSFNTRNDIEVKAVNDIDFANEERVERKASHDAADAKVQADREAVKKEQEADKAAVAKTLAERKKLIDAAQERVKKAKEDARAHQIKTAQAEQAAAIGRQMGTIEGTDAARHAWADYNSDVAKEHAQEARAAAAKKIAAHEAAVRAAVQKRTDAMQAADDAWVARADRAKDLDVAYADAQAAQEEYNIEGAEGLKNRLTDEKADWSVTHYDRRTDAAQSTIDDAAAGNFPAGDWPVGPGDDPLTAVDDFGESLAQIPSEDGPTPIHDDNAIVDSQDLDAGQVDAALGSNADKVRNQIEEQAVDTIDFADKELKERSKITSAAQAGVDAANAAVQNAYDAKQERVAEAQHKKEAVEDAAETRVKASKEKSEATYIKKTQAADAATIGRKIGEEEGDDAAPHAWSDFEGDIEDQKDQQAREQESQAIAADQASNRKAISDDTTSQKEEADDFVADQMGDAKAATADYAADAAEEENEISGPEDINNKETDIQADWSTKHYGRETDNSQKAIDDAAAGENLLQIPNEEEGVPTPEHSDKAIVDSEPSGLDAGQVDLSFHTNADKARNAIETNAASRIDFANQERVERKESHETAAAMIKADKKAVADAIAADKAAVAKAQAERKEIIDEANARVKAAKEEARAHQIKRAQAEGAAALGRQIGTIEGDDAAAHAWADYKSDVAMEKVSEARAARRKKIAAAEAAREAAVKKTTDQIEAADDAKVAASARARDLAIARADAAAATQEENIKGAEGLKNTVTDIKADWSEKHYQRRTGAAESSIENAAQGQETDDDFVDDQIDLGDWWPVDDPLPGNTGADIAIADADIAIADADADAGADMAIADADITIADADADANA